MKYEDIQRVNNEMNLTDIGKGKMYAEVPARVHAFRKLFPEGTISTEIISIPGMPVGMCIIKATVMDGDKILGTGHAYEKEGNGFVNKTSYIENCETSAVGRALSWLGLGSETSIASYEEVANAKYQQDGTLPPPKDDKKTLEQRLKKLIAQKGIREETICKQAGVKKISDMYIGQLENAIERIQA